MAAKVLSFFSSFLFFFDKMLVNVIIDAILRAVAATGGQLMDCCFLIDLAVGHRFCSV